MIPAAILVTLMAGLVHGTSVLSGSSQTQLYGLTASSNDSTINGQVINAAAGVFWINRPTGWWCTGPDGPTTECSTPPTNTTLSINGTNALLNPYIPQYAFVSEFGDFFFSEDGVPSDTEEPMIYTSTFSVSNGYLSFSGAPSWLACPAGTNYDSEHLGEYYHIFAQIPSLVDSSVSGGSIANCSQFLITASPLPAGTSPLHYD